MFFGRRRTRDDMLAGPLEPVTDFPSQITWLDAGQRLGYCSEIVCATHDGLPYTDEEYAAGDEFLDDGCVPAVRIWDLED